MKAFVAVLITFGFLSSSQASLMCQSGVRATTPASPDPLFSTVTPQQCEDGSRCVRIDTIGVAQIDPSVPATTVNVATYQCFPEVACTNPGAICTQSAAAAAGDQSLPVNITITSCCAACCATDNCNEATAASLNPACESSPSTEQPSSTESPSASTTTSTTTAGGPTTTTVAGQGTTSGATKSILSASLLLFCYVAVTVGYF